MKKHFEGVRLAKAAGGLIDIMICYPNEDKSAEVRQIMRVTAGTAWRIGRDLMKLATESSISKLMGRGS